MSAERIELTVAPGQAGLRLDQFLATPLGSRSHAQQLIDAERVRVNGRATPKRQVVHAGDRVEVDHRDVAAADHRGPDHEAVFLSRSTLTP